jgi:hypothetical protein
MNWEFGAETQIRGVSVTKRTKNLRIGPFGGRFGRAPISNTNADVGRRGPARSYRMGRAMKAKGGGASSALATKPTRKISAGPMRLWFACESAESMIAPGSARQGFARLPCRGYPGAFGTVSDGNRPPKKRGSMPCLQNRTASFSPVSLPEWKLPDRARDRSR